jgi:enoyl-CoA hydratase/carnithine racemase
MSPIAIGMIKEEVLMTYGKPLDESLSLERKLLLWQTEDHDEGIAAFTEKRKPVYKGR